MKKLITMFISGIAVAFLIVPVASAQTPDGDTPAEETVCDPLKEDGITKGLYGLCVAFCEAHDHADIFDPITEEELEALMDEAPSGKILANYNKKKDKANNGTDPDMPCILVEEPCPCWSAAELASIDGMDPTVPITLPLVCLGGTGAETIIEGSGNNRNSATARTTPEAKASCRYINYQTVPQVDRSLSVTAGTLTNPQAAACLTAVNEACNSYGY